MNRRHFFFCSSFILHPSSFRLVLPEAEAAQEGVFVVAQAAPLRQGLQFLGVAAAEHDVVGDEGGLETADDIVDRLLPPLLAQTLEAANADVVLESALLF